MERGKRTKFSYDEEIINDIKDDVIESIENQIPAEVESTGPETKNGIVVNSLFVKVRREANFDADVIELLRKGNKVTILGKEGDFYKVITSENKKIAYISSEFIKEE